VIRALFEKELPLKKIYTTSALALAFSFMVVPAALALVAGQASSKPAAKAAVKPPWVSFNPGSWVIIKSSTLAGNKETNVVETKITLLEKTADKVVLETEMTAGGQTTKTKSDLPVKGYTGALPEGVKVLKTGTGTIAIAGKSVDCETMESSMDLGGTKVLSRTWTSAQVPGSLVKSVTTSDGSQSTAQVIDFKVF